MSLGKRKDKGLRSPCVLTAAGLFFICLTSQGFEFGSSQREAAKSIQTYVMKTGRDGSAGKGMSNTSMRTLVGLASIRVMIASVIPALGRPRQVDP